MLCPILDEARVARRVCRFAAVAAALAGDAHPPLPLALIRDAESREPVTLAARAVDGRVAVRAAGKLERALREVDETVQQVLIAGVRAADQQAAVDPRWLERLRDGAARIDARLALLRGQLAALHAAPAGSAPLALGGAA